MTLKWSAPGSNDLSSANVNSLAAGGWKYLGQIDNSTVRELYMLLEVDLGASFTTKAGQPALNIAVTPVVDGTNFPDPPGTSNVTPPAAYIVGRIPARASTGFTRGIVPRAIPIPPTVFGVFVQHDLHDSTALPSSGTAVDARRFSEVDV